MRQSIIKNDVHVQDQHTEIIDLKFSQKVGDITLKADYNVDDQIIRIETTWIIPTLLHTVCLKDIDWVAFLQTWILVVTPVSWNIYDIKLDTPLDFPYTTADWCSLTITNMAVDWSVTPQIFKITPFWLDPSVEWDIIRAMFWFGWTWVSVWDPVPDDWDFWIQPALTNWVILRAKNWTIKNIFNVKTNWALRQRCWGDLLYVPASKVWIYAIHGRRTFNWSEKNWVAIRMKAKLWDELQIIIQDDLTHMNIFEAIVQWHVVED